MKYLLMLLLLTGCVDQNLYKSPITPTIDHGTPSYGSTATGISWKCEEQDINEKLVWIECSFWNNFSLKTEKVCIQVAYNENNSRQEILHSRKVCSSNLAPDENFLNYAAFIKEKRNYLTERCGPELDRCYMTTQETTAE